MLPQYTTKDITRFWTKVNKTETCWLWTASRVNTGYGRFYANRHAISAHRFSYAIAYGAIPNALCVCHRCDTPSCVRPDHLFLGTNADNSRDMTNKGRSASGDKSSARIHKEKRPRGEQHWAYKTPERMRGENNGRAQLSEQQVRDIRNRYACGALQCELAKEYNKSQSVISAIILRKLWQHVE